MNEKTEDDIVTIMNDLDKPADKDVQVIRIKSQSELLRDSLTGFVQGQLGEISKLDRVINLGLSSLANRLEANELNAADTLNVVNTLSNKKTDLSTALLDPFKPSTTAPSPLLTQPKEKEDKSDFEQGLKEMTSDEQKIIDRVFRMLQQNDKNL